MDCFANHEQVSKKFFKKNAKIVAKKLLGRILVRKVHNKFLRAKIVETEAYFGSEDPASRARQNGDLRKTMEMQEGTILVYGVHNNWMLNFVTNNEGKAEAVLIRALEPLNFEANTKGPGLITRALCINKSLHKKNVCESNDIWLESRKNNENEIKIVGSFRIGVRKDLPEKLRFYIKNNKCVSKK